LAIKHFRVISEYPDIKPSYKQELIDNMMEAFIKNVTLEIEKLEVLVEQTYKITSKLQAKAELSKIERDFKANIEPLFLLIKEQSFENKEEHLKILDDCINKLVKLCSEYEAMDRATYFMSFLENLDEKTYKKESSRKIDIEKDLQDEMKDFVVKLKALIQAGDLLTARKLFMKEKNKARDPQSIQIFEQISLDNFFFLNEKFKRDLDKVSSLYHVDKTSINNEAGDFIAVFWLRVLIPLLPIKAFAYDANNSCLGKVDLPLKYKTIRSLLPILIILFVAFVFTLIPGPKSSSQRPDNIITEEVITKAVERSPTKKEQLETILDFLNSGSQIEEGIYEETFSKFINLYSEEFNNYEVNNQVDKFLNLYGEQTLSLKNRERYGLLIHLNPQLFSLFEESAYKESPLISWYLKMGGYNVAKEFVKRQIHWADKEKDHLCLLKAVELSRTFRIKIPDESLKILYQNKVITNKEAVILCENYESLASERWREVVLDMWKLVIRFPYHEAAQVIATMEDNGAGAGLNLNLLSILIDENKDKIFQWDDVKLSFKYPAIEKRVKIRICNYFIMKGRIKEALNLSNKIPELPENDSLYFLRIPLFYFQKQYSRIISFLEKYSKNNSLDEYYNSILGLAYTELNKSDKAVELLASIVNKNYDDFIMFWDKLNKRKNDLRKYVDKQLNQKKGRFEAPARKFYLMQDDMQAKLARENFISKEIEKDFNVKKLKEQLDSIWHISRAIYSLIETYIKQNNIVKLRKSKEILLALRNRFYSYDTEVILAKVFFRLDQESEVKEILTHTEARALKMEEYLPLISILTSYKEMNFDDRYKKLTKKIFKKCKDMSFLRIACLHLADLSPALEDKLRWLNKIKKKNIYDNIRINLIESDMALKNSDFEKLIQFYNNFSLNFNQQSKTQDIFLIERIGKSLFFNYRLTGDIESLRQSIINFKRLSIIEDTNPVYLNELANALWFYVLENAFSSSEYLNFLKENNFCFLWDNIEKEIDNGNGNKIIEIINKTEEFDQFKIIFNKILSIDDSFVIIPPGFFQIILAEGVDFQAVSPLKYINNVEIRSESVFWGLNKINYSSYILGLMKVDEEKARKILKNISQEDLTRFARATLVWTQAVLRQWKFSKEPLKMGFTNLIKKVAFASALSDSLKSQRMGLDIKVFKLALWHDPEKKLLRKLSPSLIILRAHQKKQSIKQIELQGINERGRKLIKEYYPFINDNLLFLLSLEDKKLLISLNKRQKEIISLYIKCSKFDYEKKALQKFL